MTDVFGTNVLTIAEGRKVLKEALRFTDRTIGRLVRTGTLTRNISENIPTSMYAEKEAPTRKIMEDVIKRSDDAVYFREKYLNYAIPCVPATQIFPAMELVYAAEGIDRANAPEPWHVVNSLDFTSSRVQNGHCWIKSKFPARPQYTRKRRKQIVTMVAQMHGVHMAFDDIMNAVMQCYPALRPRKHKTVGGRNQFSAYRLKNTPAKHTKAMFIDAQMVKLKLYRNELANQIRILDVAEVIIRPELWSAMPVDKAYASASTLLELFTAGLDDDVAPEILERICDDGELTEQWLDKFEEENALRTQKHVMNPKGRETIEDAFEMVFKIDWSFAPRSVSEYLIECLCTGLATHFEN